MLALEPGHRVHQEGRQLHVVEIGGGVILATPDLQACAVELAALPILEQHVDADHVLGPHVVAVARIRSHHPHQLLVGRRHHVDGDAVLVQLLVEGLHRRKGAWRIDRAAHQLVALVIADRHRLAGGHHLVDMLLELLQAQPGEGLRNPRITDQIVDGAQAQIIRIQAFAVTGRVLERNQLQRRIEIVARQHLAVFQIGQQRLGQVELVAGVVHVEHRVLGLVGVLADQRLQLPGGPWRPVLQAGFGMGSSHQPKGQGAGEQRLGKQAFHQGLSRSQGPGNRASGGDTHPGTTRSKIT